MGQNEIIPPTPSAEAYAVDEDQGDVFTSDDPIALFSQWFELAKAHEANDPNAMSLATVDAEGRPDVRIVLLKDLGADGFSFFTNTTSAKGAQLAARGEAALAFHWKSIRRQVRVRGRVTPVSDAEADAYFAKRARGAQIGAWASDQSREIANGVRLEAAVAETEARFEGADVPRPPHWSGYLVAPREIEFWVNRPYRLHDRRLFAREGGGDGWRVAQLYP
ncbi:MAG: pyridoxamine 5'-phosphate oxidase [Parvularculaceae bacterium]